MSQKQAVILSFSCSATTCHDISGSAAGLALTPMNFAYLNLVNMPSSGCALIRVEPFDSPSSNFFRKLEGTQTCGARMPFNGPPFLNAGQLDTIRDWIDEGAPNN